MIFLALICPVISLHACRQPVTQTGGKLRILTTIAPLYSFAKNVAGDEAIVDNLIPSGVGPHEYSLSPGDARKVSETRILIINGVKLEAWLNKLQGPASESPTNDNKKLIIVDTSAGVELIGNDPHIWLSPRNAIMQVKNIRDALVKVDPDNSETYTKNSSEYIQRLGNLDKEIRNEIRTWKQNRIVTYHPAFKYFAGEYGLELAVVIQETPEIEPSPKHIAHVIETIKSKGIRAIFTEPQFSHKIVTSLAGDLNLQVYSLDTLETGLFSKEWYEDSIRSNLQVLKKALN
ncbi:MAG: zinc ABC transporter substrate-binding protein [Nitrospirae bacterium]|nr:zinc ABC transporter substrate-binding protein [Nitrospirota bacterium]